MKGRRVEAPIRWIYGTPVAWHSWKSLGQEFDP
jgi:hypothetical protein